MDKKHLQTTAKEIQRLDRLASRALKNGDKEAFGDLMEDIGAIKSVLSVSQRETIDRYTRDTLTIHKNVFLNLLKEGKADIAFRQKRYMNDDE